MIIQPGVVAVLVQDRGKKNFFLKENYMGKKLFQTLSAPLPPGRAGAEGELNLKDVFQVQELINGALCSTVLL